MIKNIQCKGELSNSIFSPSLVTPHLLTKNLMQYDIFVNNDPNEQALHFNFARQALDVFYIVQWILYFLVGFLTIICYGIN
jgi:hypothetical protein